MNVRPFALIAFVRERLSPKSETGLRLTLAVALLICAAWLFGGVAEDVATGDPLVRVDAYITAWFHAHVTPGATHFMLIVTNFHGPIGIGLLGSALFLYFAWKKDWYWLLTVVTALPGGMLLNVLLKLAFHRGRPGLSEPLLTLAGYSFPSGHVAGATLFYGLLVAWVVFNIRVWQMRVIVVVAACAVVILVGISRIYLGVHYFSDVVAAAAASTAWLVASLLLVDSLRRKRQVPIDPH